MIRIYTELGSLFDERRMILCKLAREAGHYRFDWNHNFLPVYKERRCDIFEYPEFGFSKEAYDERYARRSKEDFGSRTENFLFPSRLCRDMFQVVREYEFGAGKQLMVTKFSVVVNIWPYALDEYEKEELVAAIKGTVVFPFDVELVNYAPEQLTPYYLHGFDYVFKYDYLLSERMKNYWDAYAAAPGGAVRFVVPDLFRGKVDLPEGMEAETPKDLIDKLNLVQGGKVTWISCDKRIYDSYS